MIPETAQQPHRRDLPLRRLPARWKLERVLLEGVRLRRRDAPPRRPTAGGCSPTPRGREPRFNDELHLFYADAPARRLAAARPQPGEVRRALRAPGGRALPARRRAYRPAQICVPRYGAGLSLNRVLRLTPHEYAEREVRAHRCPRGERGLLGLHTVNRAGDLTVIDAFARGAGSTCMENESAIRSPAPLSRCSCSAPRPRRAAASPAWSTPTARHGLLHAAGRSTTSPRTATAPRGARRARAALRALRHFGRLLAPRRRIGGARAYRRRRAASGATRRSWRAALAARWPVVLHLHGGGLRALLRRLRPRGAPLCASSSSARRA